MLKGREKQRTTDLLKAQILGELDEELSIEIYRLAADAVREVATWARQQYEMGTFSKDAARDRIDALGMYLDYLRDEIGLNPENRFERLDIRSLRTGEVSFRFFLEKIYRKDQKYTPVFG